MGRSSFGRNILSVALSITMAVMFSPLGETPAFATSSTTPTQTTQAATAATASAQTAANENASATTGTAATATGTATATEATSTTATDAAAATTSSTDTSTATASTTTPATSATSSTTTTTSTATHSTVATSSTGALTPQSVGDINVSGKSSIKIYSTYYLVDGQRTDYKGNVYLAGSGDCEVLVYDMGTDGSVVLQGVTLSGSNSTIAFKGTGGKLQLDAGTTNTVDCTAEKYAAIDCDASHVVISGDGSLNASGGKYGAGIGHGAYSHTTANIEIKGGTITATGGERASASAAPSAAAPAPGPMSPSTVAPSPPPVASTPLASAAAIRTPTQPMSPSMAASSPPTPAITVPA